MPPSVGVDPEVGLRKELIEMEQRMGGAKAWRLVPGVEDMGAALLGKGKLGCRSVRATLR